MRSSGSSLLPDVDPSAVRFANANLLDFIRLPAADTVIASRLSYFIRHPEWAQPSKTYDCRL